MCVSFNIENIMLVANIVNAVKRCFYICKAFLFALLDYGSPFLKCNFGFGIFGDVFFQCLFCENPHIQFFRAKLLLSFVITKYLGDYCF